jgi:putative FmdB family regulatory protein
MRCIDPYNRAVPVYEYVCLSCGTHVEVYQRFNDGPLTECGVCQGKLRRVFHPAGILFKGSGFYATDSRSSAGRGSGDTSKGEPGSKPEMGSKGESAKTGSGSKGERRTGAGSGSTGGSAPPTPKKERSA